MHLPVTAHPTPRRCHRTGRTVWGAAWLATLTATALAGCSGPASTKATPPAAGATGSSSAKPSTSASSGSVGTTAASPTTSAPAASGSAGQAAPVVDRSVAHPDGLLVPLRIPGFDARLEPVQVWLPPQYFQPTMTDHRFPVLLGLGAMHATGESFVKTTRALQVARQGVASGQVAPFIGVYLPSRTAYDVDSECVDLPGIASQSVYTQQVVQAVSNSFATVAPGKGWFTEGYSTGGQCAALLQARHPDVFTASVSMAGYFTPLYDVAGAKLATRSLTEQNSPLWLVQHGRLQRLDLLSIASRHDPESWGRPGAVPLPGQGDGAQFHAAAAHLPGTDFLMATGSGHTREGYQPYWLPALEWLGRKGL